MRFGAGIVQRFFRFRQFNFLETVGHQNGDSLSGKGLCHEGPPPKKGSDFRLLPAEAVYVQKGLYNLMATV